MRHGKSSSPNKTSRYRGVSRAGGKYRAQIGVDEKILQLGYYLTEVEAARAYNIAVLARGWPEGMLNKGV